MNKTELLNRFSRDTEERVTLARVLDQMERAQNRSIPCATQFLSPAQRAAAEPLLAWDPAALLEEAVLLPPQPANRPIIITAARARASFFFINRSS